MINPQNIFLSRAKKEELTSQNAKAIWLTGLSGSGKTTIAYHLEQKLHNTGFLTKIFDGDIVRSTFNKHLGYSESDRFENIQRIAQINKEFIDCGIIVINCFVSPTIKIRSMARDIIGQNDFIEIYVNCSLQTCENRDIKGLYKKTREGLISNFTGINSLYEAPINPDYMVETEKESEIESVDRILKFILPQISIK